MLDRVTKMVRRLREGVFKSSSFCFVGLPNFMQQAVKVNQQKQSRRSAYATVSGLFDLGHRNSLTVQCCMVSLHDILFFVSGQHPCISCIWIWTCSHMMSYAGVGLRPCRRLHRLLWIGNGSEPQRVTATDVRNSNVYQKCISKWST